MAQGIVIHQEIGQVLEEIAKVQKIAQFYPIEHPMVLRGIERLEGHLRRLQPRITQIDLVIQKNSFLFQQAQLPGKEDLLKNLAYEFARRFVRELHIELPLEPQDLRAFVLLLVREPAVIKEAEGPEGFLARERARRIWVNAHRFELNQIAPQEEEEHEHEEEVEVSPEPVSDRVSRFREELKNAQTPEEMEAVLSAIVTYVREEVKARKEDIHDSVLLLEILADHQAVSTDRHTREMMGEAMLAIAYPPVIVGEIIRIERAREAQWRKHAQILVQLGHQVTPFIIQTLATTTSRRFRTRLLSTIRMLGSPTVRYLIKFLTDTRWYLVRNIILLLGDVGDNSLVPLIEPHLNHEDRRVREAALESLRKLGGDESLKSLLRFISSHRSEDERALAVEKLVSFPSQAVVPHLIEYVEEGGKVGETALRIMGELEPPGFTQYLGDILNKRPFLFFRKRLSSLRPVAAELLCLKLPETWDLLKRYASDDDPQVRRWVAHAVEWLQKNRAVVA